MSRATLSLAHSCARLPVLHLAGCKERGRGISHHAAQAPRFCLIVAEKQDGAPVRIFLESEGVLHISELAKACAHASQPHEALPPSTRCLTAAHSAQVLTCGLKARAFCKPQIA